MALILLGAPGGNDVTKTIIPNMKKANRNKTKVDSEYSNQTNGEKCRNQDIALKRFGSVIGYLQYENSAFWIRFYYLVTLGFAGMTAIRSLDWSGPHGPIWKLLALLAGLLWSVFSARIIARSRDYSKRFVAILRDELESDAFDQIRIFRGHESLGITQIAVWMGWFVAFVWLFLALAQAWYVHDMLYVLRTTG